MTSIDYLSRLLALLDPWGITEGGFPHFEMDIEARRIEDIIITEKIVNGTEIDDLIRALIPVQTDFIRTLQWTTLSALYTKCLFAYEQVIDVEYIRKLLLIWNPNNEKIHDLSDRNPYLLQSKKIYDLHERRILDNQAIAETFFMNKPSVTSSFKISIFLEILKWISANPI